MKPQQSQQEPNRPSANKAEWLNQQLQCAQQQMESASTAAEKAERARYIALLKQYQKRQQQTADSDHHDSDQDCVGKSKDLDQQADGAQGQNTGKLKLLSAIGSKMVAFARTRFDGSQGH
jgi:hypothetical protein